MEEYFKVNGIKEESLLDNLASISDENVINRLYKILLAYSEYNEKLKEIKDNDLLEKLNGKFDRLIKDYLMNGDLFDDIEEQYYYNSFGEDEMIKAYMYLPCIIYVLQKIMDKLLLKK